jgi:hypothetical protein
MTSSAPLARYFWKWPSTSLSTIVLFRSRTVAMSIRPPNSRTYDAILAEWTTFLLGRQAMFGHDPPTYFRSTTAARFPRAARVHDSTLPATPLPITTRS